MAKTYIYSYNELAAPLEQVQKKHDDTLNTLGELSNNTEILNKYLDPERDSVSYNLYNNFKKEFTEGIEDFYKNGLNKNNGNKLLNLKRYYNDNIANILSAIKDRELERAEQQKIKESSKGQAIFSKDADYTSVDDYLQGNKGYELNNLDEIQKDAKNFAKAASDRHTEEDYSQKMFNNEYWRLYEKTGYNYLEAYNILQTLSNQYDNEQHPGFIKRMNEALDARQIKSFSPKDQARMIESYLNGIDEGLFLKEEIKPIMTSETRQKGGTNISINNRDIPKDDTPISTNDFIVKSNFENNEEKQKDILNKILVSNFITETNFKDSKGNPLHRFLTEEEYLKKYYGYYKDQNGIWRNKYGRDVSKYKSEKVHLAQYRIDYKNQLEEIENEFHLSPNSTGNGFGSDIKTMISPMSPNETLENYLNNKIVENVNYSKPHTITTYQLYIDNSNKNDVIQRTINQYGTDLNALTSLTYNPKSGLFKFGKSIDTKKILDEIAIDNNYSKGSSIINLIYAPQSKNDPSPLYVQMKVLGVNNNEPFYFPLSAFASKDATILSNSLVQWKNEREEILNRNLRLLNIPRENITLNMIDKYEQSVKNNNKLSKDDKLYYLDILAQCKESLQIIDFYTHKFVKTPSASANPFSTKEIEVDLNDKQKTNK